MKRIAVFIVSLIFFLPISIFADTPLPDPTQRPDALYRLFRTSNMWTFIKLNTQDGRMWQLQFDVEGDNRFTVVLNDQPLVNTQKIIPGRFTLYPTANIFSFILLDQVDGRTWQVQWSINQNQRTIIPIK